MNDTNTHATAGATELAGCAVAEHLHLDQSTISKIGQLSVAAAAIHQQGDAFFSVVPDGYRATNITAEVEAAALTPRRKTGTVNLADVASFATFVSQQGSTDRKSTRLNSSHWE